MASVEESFGYLLQRQCRGGQGGEKVIAFYDGLFNGRKGKTFSGLCTTFAKGKVLGRVACKNETTDTNVYERNKLGIGGIADGMVHGTTDTAGAGAADTASLEAAATAGAGGAASHVHAYAQPHACGWAATDGGGAG